MTTEPCAIGRAPPAPSPKTMTAVFCTYRSLGLIERAQDEGAPELQRRALAISEIGHNSTKQLRDHAQRIADRIDALAAGRREAP